MSHDGFAGARTIMNDGENGRNPAPAADDDWASRGRVHTFVLAALTTLGIYLCYLMALPFLPALAWALVLAILSTPFHRWVESKGRRPTLAAVVTLLVIGVIVVLPATFLVKRLAREAALGADLIKTKIESKQWRQVVKDHPRLAPLAGWVEEPDVMETAKTLAAWTSTTGAAFVRGSVTRVVGVVLTFYLLFFFLRDRGAVLRAIRALSPLSEAETDGLFQRVADTIYATIYGMVAVAAAQGLLGGLMFWWLGLPAPLLWGIVMALLAMIPLLGPIVVWAPATLFLLMDGHWVKALVLVIWCVAVVGTVDNLLRPILVGRRLKLHTVVTFIAVLGGLLVFGATGLVLGPLVLTITAALLEVWRARTAPPPPATPPVKGPS